MAKSHLSTAAPQIWLIPLLLLAASSESLAQPATNDAGPGSMSALTTQANEGVYIGSVESISGGTLVITIDPRLAAWSRGPKPGSQLQFRLAPGVKFETAIIGRGAPSKPSDLRVGDEVTVHYVRQGSEMVATRLFQTASGVHVVVPSAAPVQRASANPQGASVAAAPLRPPGQARLPPEPPAEVSATSVSSALAPHAAADKKLQETIRNSMNYRTAAEWTVLWNNAKQANRAALSSPSPEPTEPAARAQFEKGVQLYQSGDPAQAAQWFAKCAQSGDPYCEVQLGSQYEAGKGLRQDLSKAASLYVRAAQADSSRAQNNLGNLYAQGLGVPLNNQEAARWFAASASQGDPDGLYSLARMYEFGFGVPTNRITAVNLYRAAALRGNLQAVETAHWLSDPTNVSFPDEASRDAYLAQLQTADSQWHGCEANVGGQRRLGFRMPDCMRQWVNPRTW